MAIGEIVRLSFSEGVNTNPPEQSALSVTNLKTFADVAAFLAYKGSAAAEGDIFESSTDHLIYYYGDGAWVTIPVYPTSTANQVLGSNNDNSAKEFKTLNIGTSGTDFAIAHAAGSITFNLPDAGAAARGAITTGAQTIAGQKTLSSSPIITNLKTGLNVVSSDTLTTAIGEIDSALTDSKMSGFISWGGAGNYYSVSGSQFNILRSGTGRIKGKLITWAGSENVSLSANKAYFIGYSATNTAIAIDYSAIYNADKLTHAENFHTMLMNNVILFSTWCDKDGVINMVSKNNHPYEYSSDIASHDHFRLGSVFLFSGAVLTLLNASNRTVQSVGADLIDDHGVFTNIPDGSGVALDTIGIWRNASGFAQRYYRRSFTVSGISVTPTAGATYTNNSSTFTVLYTNIVAGSGTIYTWRSSGTNEPDASGTLTKASGTGDASITYSAFTINKVVPSSYANAGVPTPLSSSGANRFGISAIFALPNDFQTPNTTNPVPNYIAVLSTTAYTTAANAANSIGTGTSPDLTQFNIPLEIMPLEPVLMGFALADGNGNIIPATNTNGFINGIRSFKQTASTSTTAGAVAVAAAANVSVDTTAFDGWLSATETDLQTALNKIDDTGKDGTFKIRNTADPTKILIISVASITAGQTRTATFPDADLTVVGIATTQQLTNKDIDGGTASNSNRMTLPKNTTANLNALTRKEATLVYDTTTKQVKYDDGTTLTAVGSGSGGGGGGPQLIWRNDGLNAWDEVTYFNQLMYAAYAGGSQKLYTCLTIPTSYTVGANLVLKGTILSDVGSGNILLTALATLIRSASADIEDTDDQFTSTNTAQTISAAKKPYQISLDLTASGQINSNDLTAGDLILIELTRGTDTNTGNCYLIPGSIEVVIA